eukprot:CAMPEP_0113457532 /NCGR_PEP_ID=MMETSP0014_2-20120614/9458_1 /TAXON_ID=2857 /ORGANISM="Nitzschia sp." /LENGTH=634 /DNA_ID=CAMNT_0000349033 /DNA_START=412 /DNA_END=2317 /DNA_ORIENTATION=- /assembly_acc=CAM_ASM_000159
MTKMIRSILPFFPKQQQQQQQTTTTTAAEVAVDPRGRKSSSATKTAKTTCRRNTTVVKRNGDGCTNNNEETVIKIHQLQLQQQGELSLQRRDKEGQQYHRPQKPQQQQQQQQQQRQQNKQRSFKNKLYNISKRSLMVNADESFRRLDCDDDDSSSNSHSYRSNSSHRDELNKSLSDRLKFTFSESLSNTTNFDDPRDESFVGGKDAESGGSVTLSNTSAHENEEKEDEEEQEQEQEELKQQLHLQQQLHKDGQKSCMMSLMDSSDDRMEDDHHTACSTGTRPRASSENQVEFLKVLLNSSSFSSSSLSPAAAAAAAAALESNPHPSDASGENGDHHAFGQYETTLKGIDDSDYDDEESVDSLLEHLPPIPDLDNTPTKHESPRGSRSLTEALSTRTNQETEMTMIPSQQQDEEEDEDDDDDDDEISEGSTSSVSLNDLFVSPTISVYKEKRHHSMPLHHVTDLLGSRSDVLSSKENRQRTPERSASDKKKRSQRVTKNIGHNQHSASTRSLPRFCDSPTAASIHDIRTERPKPHRTKSASVVMLGQINRKEGRANLSARRSRGGTPQGIELIVRSSVRITANVVGGGSIPAEMPKMDELIPIGNITKKALIDHCLTMKSGGGARPIAVLLDRNG